MGKRESPNLNPYPRRRYVDGLAGQNLDGAFNTYGEATEYLSEEGFKKYSW